MNFHGVADDTGKEIKEVVDYILKLNISPQDKRKLLISVFRTVGSKFFDKMFSDASELFDSTAMSSNGLHSNDNQIQRLATKLLRNDALGRSNNLTKEYFNAIQSDAFEEAFTNAKSLDKHPTLTRYVVGETCKWCNALAGVHINPTSDMYRRHADCDCILEYSGSNGRREIVKNYTKKGNSKWNTSVNVPTGVSNYDSKLREEYDKIPIEKVSKKWLFTGIDAKTGRNLYDTKLTNAELNFIEKLRRLNIDYEIIPPRPGISTTNDIKMLSDKWELKTRVSMGDNAISWAISKVTDGNKTNIILDVSYMNRPLTWIFDKIDMHLATNKNAHKITGIFVVREGRLIRYK